MNPLSADALPRLIAQIETVIRGKRPQIEIVLTALLAGGHALLEDNPGTGKTVMARTLAQCISGNAAEGHAVFKRIQFTPDLLPLDLIGAHIFDDRSRDFSFRRGPIFCNILLADEINRASPKVQSALLEAMAEGQITTGDQTYLLEKVFFTIATQNPVEMEGTYPLPAAQLDRFFVKLHFGYVDEETELDIYRSYAGIGQNLTDLQAVLTLDDVVALQREAEAVFVHEEILRSVAHIVRRTREHDGITLGASTRAGIAFIRCLRAFALVQGRDFVAENDVPTLAHHVLHHRLAFRNREAKAGALEEIVRTEADRLSRLKLF